MGEVEPAQSSGVWEDYTGLEAPAARGHSAQVRSDRSEERVAEARRAAAASASMLTELRSVLANIQPL